MWQAFFIGLAILLVALVLFRWALRRATTVCELRARAGDLRVVRGGLRSNVLGDLEDVVRERGLDGLTLRVVREPRRARLDVRGQIDPGSLQRLRNVIGNVPMSALAKRG